MKKLALLVVLTLLTISCSHEEGYGGLATIRGKVFGRDFNTGGNLVGEGYVGGFKVYISKHGDPNYFDSKDSAPDGSFKFDYLHKGKYDIWVFGDCDYCSWDQVYVLKTINISSKRQTIETEDFVVSF